MAVGKFNKDPNYDDDIEFIGDSERVQGDPAGTDPDITPLTGTANKIFQKIVNSLVYLKDAIDNASIDRMTDTVFGIGRTATPQEAEGGSAHGAGGPLLTPQRGIQLLRGPEASANTTRRGTVQRLTQAQARAMTDTSRYLTVALLLDVARNAADIRADTSRYGVVRTATESEVANNVGDDVVTVGSLYRSETIDWTSNIRLTNTSSHQTVSLTSTSGTVTGNYFGPIVVGQDSTTITLTIRLVASQTSQGHTYIEIPDLDLSKFTWAGANQLTYQAGEDRLRFFYNNTGSDLYTPTITGTLQ